MVRLLTFHLPKLRVIDNNMFDNECWECSGNQSFVYARVHLVIMTTRDYTSLIASKIVV